MASKSSKQDGAAMCVDQVNQGAKNSGQGSERSANLPTGTAKTVNENTKGVKMTAMNDKSSRLPGSETDDENGKDEIIYRKENTVIVNVEEKEIKINDLLETVENICGDNTVLACVPCGRNVFEMTMIDRNCMDILVPKIDIGDICVSVSPANERSTVVSIIHLPPYVTDSEIVDKLQTYNVSIVSPIYRKYHVRQGRRNRIADGTRYFRVKFPKNVKSLPWSLVFDIDGSAKHFRTIHNNQEKVCFKCCSTQHLAKDCELNQCYTCKEYGHISWNCPEKKCQDCNKNWDYCECVNSDDSENEDSEEYDTEESTNDEEQESMVVDVDPVSEVEMQKERKDENKTHNDRDTNVKARQAKKGVTKEQNVGENSVCTKSNMEQDVKTRHETTEKQNTTNNAKPQTQKIIKTNAEMIANPRTENFEKSHIDINAKRLKVGETTQQSSPVDSSQPQQVRTRRRTIKVTPNLNCERRRPEEQKEDRQDGQKPNAVKN